LYDLYMDTSTSDDEFAEEIYDMFGHEAQGGMSSSEWSSKYGIYLPSYDQSPILSAKRQKQLDLETAYAGGILNRAKSGRILEEGQADLRTGLGIELAKGREAQGKVGLRSGRMNRATEEAITRSGDQVENLSDAYTLQMDENRDATNSAVVSAALDFDKAEAANKRDFYDRIMSTIATLTEIGAFDSGEEGEDWEEGCDTRCNTFIPVDMAGGMCVPLTNVPGCEGGVYYEESDNGTILEGEDPFWW